MYGMTNFYEELKLDKAMSSAELQDNLIRLESTVSYTHLTLPTT